MHRKTKFNYLLAGSFLILHLVLFLLLLWYQSNIRVYSSIAFYADQEFQVAFSTPLNKSQTLTKDLTDTIELPCRPISQIYLKVSGESIRITDSINSDITHAQKISTARLPVVGYRILSNSDKSLPGILIFILRINGKAGLFFLLLIYLIFFAFLVLLNRHFIVKWYKRKVLRFYRWLSCTNKGTENQAATSFIFNTRQWCLVALIVITFCFSIFYQLGKRDLMQTEHEPLRALVALEMKISGNYIVPVKLGEPYLNKMPLFSWIIAPFTDDEVCVEGKLRAVSMMFILLTSLTVFFFTYRLLELKSAVLGTLLYMGANGVFGFKQLQIDQFFAFLCVLIFFINFYFASSKKYWKLFIFSYIIITLGFLTKGFVIFWFQGISLILSLYITHSLRKLFSREHLSGLLILLVVTGFYFFQYSRFADPLAFLRQQISEDDSITGYSLLYRIRYFLLFPLKNIYYYLPAFAFMPVLFFRKGLYNIHKNPFSRYLFYLVLLSITIFWISPSYTAYYILMLVPAVTILIAVNYKGLTESSFWFKLLCLLGGSMLLIDNWLLGLIPFLAIAGFLFLRRYRLELLLFALLINMVLMTFLTPQYPEGKDHYNLKLKTERIVKQYPDSRVFLFSRDTKCQDALLFYFTYHTKQILSYREGAATPGDLYLANKEQITNDFVIVDSLTEKVYSQQSLNRIGQMNDIWLYVIQTRGVRINDTVK